MKKEIEVRSSKQYEIRAIENEGKKVLNLSIPYNSKSEDLGFYETLKPGCFSKTISDGFNVRALFNHETSKILGAVKNGTLSFQDTPESLNAQITLPETREAEDVYNLIKTGYIENCSFGMRVIKDEWRQQDKKQYRDVHEAHLVEVSPVTFPAYPASIATSLRSFYEAKGINTDELEKALLENNKDEIRKLLDPFLKEPSADKVTDYSLYEGELELLKLGETK